MSSENLGRQFDDIIGRNFPDDRPKPTGDEVEDIVKQATYEHGLENPTKESELQDAPGMFSINGFKSKLKTNRHLP